jgi:hypothetical protein
MRRAILSALLALGLVVPTVVFTGPSAEACHRKHITGGNCGQDCKPSPDNSKKVGHC